MCVFSRPGIPDRCKPECLEYAIVYNQMIFGGVLHNSYPDTIPFLPVVLRLAGPVVSSPGLPPLPAQSLTSASWSLTHRSQSGTAGRIPGTGSGTPDTFPKLPDRNKPDPDCTVIEMPFPFPVRWDRAFRETVYTKKRYPRKCHEKTQDLYEDHLPDGCLLLPVLSKHRVRPDTIKSPTLDEPFVSMRRKGSDF